MSYSSVFWQYFVATGRIGSYLLYKYCSDEILLSPENVVEEEVKEVASERG